MEIDVFEQLAERQVPPAPESLQRDIHERLNRLLLVLHLAELFFKGGAYALGHGLRGLLGLVTLTVTGRFPTDESRQNQGPPADSPP